MKTKFSKTIKTPYKLIDENKLNLFIICGEYKYQTKNYYCNSCGKKLRIVRIGENEYKLVPCNKCTKTTHYLSLEKLKTLINNDELTKKIFNDYNLYKTRNLNKDKNHNSVAGKIAWVKVLRQHPEKISTRIEYWLAKGYTEEEAKLKLKERQTTFSLEKCIEKYGKEEGYKKWKERQDKWQNSLNNKSNAEISSIRKKQMCNGLSYSKISQELFWNIYNEIKNDYKEIYFATLEHNDNDYDNITTRKKINFEYYYRNDDIKKGYFLDFYIKDNNKVIEFDGDYWHHRDSQTEENDIKKEKILLDAGFKILHIKELNYRKNSDKILKECIEWIKNDDN